MLTFFSRDNAKLYLKNLPKMRFEATQLKTCLSSKQYAEELINAIEKAKERITLVVLYLEHDEAGIRVLEALFSKKVANPQVEINIFVDWHRAQRGRIGEGASNTNADWYCAMKKKHPEINLPIYGVPINTREALGVLHFKGIIIDDTLIYSGASINNVYLHQLDKYRYDRYHFLQHPALADSFYDYLHNKLLQNDAVKRLDCLDRPKTNEFKRSIKQFRQALTKTEFTFPKHQLFDDELSLMPIVGLGNKNPFNQLLVNLLWAAEQHVTICTPYFNLPKPIARLIRQFLKMGGKVELIIGDKTANDFYIPESEPFRAIGALPYLYEINLRKFMQHARKHVEQEQLVVRLWKDEANSFHLKGMWIDDKWTLITGNNLNPRAWRLDLENGILIHDPKGELRSTNTLELNTIRQNTRTLNSYEELETLDQYPIKVKKLIRRVKRLRLDRIISRIL